MRVKALLKNGNTEVRGHWVNYFDEWAIFTDKGEIILIDNLENYDSYPWLPHDHFCQPKNLKNVTFQQSIKEDYYEPHTLQSIEPFPFIEKYFISTTDSAYKIRTGERHEQTMPNY
jgi:hypothetical protein